jgi:putative oxidoreductase
MKLMDLYISFYNLLNKSVMDTPDKLAAAKGILQENSNYERITSSGKLAVLKNGIEFAITYFIMLLSLYFTGGGKFTSLDYFLAKRYIAKI